MKRWYLLDAEFDKNTYRALCYEDDKLVECESFANRNAALERGETWLYDGDLHERDD